MLCQQCNTAEAAPRKPGGKQSIYCGRNCEQTARRKRNKNIHKCKRCRVVISIADSVLYGLAAPYVYCSAECRDVDFLAKPEIEELELRGATYRRGPRLKDWKLGVYAAEPPPGSDAAVVYVVSTKMADTEHDSFSEAREEYLLRTGRMSA